MKPIPTRKILTNVTRKFLQCSRLPNADKAATKLLAKIDEMVPKYQKVIDNPYIWIIIDMLNKSYNLDGGTVFIKKT